MCPPLGMNYLNRNMMLLSSIEKEKTLMKSLIVLFMILFVSVRTNVGTSIRSVTTTLKSQMRFERLNTSWFIYEDFSSHSRWSCLTACLNTGYCHTITFIRIQRKCFLYAEQFFEGILIDDSTAETIHLSRRYSRKEQTIESLIENILNLFSIMWYGLCQY